MRILKSLLVVIINLILFPVSVITIGAIIKPEINTIIMIAYGDWNTLIASADNAIIIPISFVVIGGTVGLVVRLLTHYLNTPKTLKITTIILVTISIVLQVGIVWYCTIPRIWQYMNSSNFLLYTISSIGYVFDITISIILMYLLYYIVLNTPRS